MIVRFSEFEWYDINHDEDWVRFMATVTNGSYFSEVPRGTARVFRENRAKFKEMTLEAIRSCIRPGEIELV